MNQQFKSELNNRVLRFDGVSEVDFEQVVPMLLLGVPASKIRVSRENEDIASFNHQVGEEDQILPVGEEEILVDLDWQIPEPYRSLDIERYIAVQFELRCPSDYTQDQFDTALDRIAAELAEIEARGMVEFMRTIIYILVTLREHDVVWGVGRGSSCACYLLFIIGLHAVDCVKFEVPMNEFFHS